MTQDEAALRGRLEALRVEHRDLDDAITRLEEGPYVDQLQLRRLKKRRLQLRDYIARIHRIRSRLAGTPVSAPDIRVAARVPARAPVLIDLQ